MNFAKLRTRKLTRRPWIHEYLARPLIRATALRKISKQRKWLAKNIQNWCRCCVFFFLVWGCFMSQWYQACVVQLEGKRKSWKFKPRLKPKEDITVFSCLCSKTWQSFRPKRIRMAQFSPRLFIWRKIIVPSFFWY